MRRAVKKQIDDFECVHIGIYLTQGRISAYMGQNYRSGSALESGGRVLMEDYR